MAPAALSARIAPVTIPNWQSTFIYGGQPYPFQIAGSDPRNGGSSTTIAVEIIPVKLEFSDGTILDPSSSVHGLKVSPLFVSAPFAEGTTQYGDAVMRSEFWSYVAGTDYHVLFASPLVEREIALAVPPADGYTQTTASGHKRGFVTFAWFIDTVEPQILQQLSIDPTTLAMFATYNTKVVEPSGYCCYDGYHAAFPMTVNGVSSISTTIWASITYNAVETVSHEVADWLNDPFYTNYVPKWIQPGTTACGGDQLEAGDPVTGRTFRLNGYGLQDAAFFSWFSRDSASTGLNGKYDLLGSLTTPAVDCP